MGHLRGALLPRAQADDLQRPEPRYPTRVWHACLEVARQYTFPELSPEEAYRRLGNLFMDGYFDLQMEMKKEGERHDTLVLREQGVQADFCAGLLDSAFRPTRAQAVVDVVERGPAHCVLHVRW